MAPLHTFQEFAQEVEEWILEFPEARAVVPLKEALDGAGDAWIADFRDADGVTFLCGVRESEHLQEYFSVLDYFVLFCSDFSGIVNGTML